MNTNDTRLGCMFWNHNGNHIEGIDWIDITNEEERIIKDSVEGRIEPGDDFARVWGGDQKWFPSPRIKILLMCKLRTRNARNLEWYIMEPVW